eukprot:jgi/Mesvir1/28932/Mv17716-RA.2
MGEQAALPLPDVRSLAVDEASAVGPLIEHLVGAGVRELHCINDDWQEATNNERCLAVGQIFSDGLAGRSSMSHEVHRMLSVMTSFLQSMQATLQASGTRINETALVLLSCETYSIVRQVVREEALMVGAHLAVFCASMDVVADMAEGYPVTALDYPLYSQAYAAVALAAYELRTSKALTVDITARARLLARDKLTEQDVRSAACRHDGFPVCGAPGVAEVSEHGCACFNRSAVSLRVLSTLPALLMLQNEAQDGMLDASRDLHGATFVWNQNPASTVSSWDAIAEIESVIHSSNWTAVLSLDHILATVEPMVDAQMSALGAVLGGRSFWLAADRDQRVGISTYLQRYNATGYVGPNDRTWAAIGAHAREVVEGMQAARGGPDALLFLPMRGLPKWAQMASLVVDGFFSHKLSFPEGFWATPVAGDPAARTGVWARFYDDWTAPVTSNGAANGSALQANVVMPGTSSIPGSPLGSPIGFQIRQSPPLTDTMRAFELGLAAELAGANGSFSAVMFHPGSPFASAIAMRVLEESAAQGHGSAQLMSLMCRGADMQALLYPDSMVGGHRAAACVDWQSNLSTYVAFLASALRQHTGELCDRSIPHVSHLSLRTALLLLCGVLVLLLILAVLALRYRVLHPLFERAAHDKWHKQHAPQRLQTMTVVFTDIEGSTALWEWNSDVMNECLQIHHRVIRSLLIKHHGYESNTEGDAFELVFHDAADALSWALEAQETLLRPETLAADAKGKKVVRPKPWPAELLFHEMGRERHAKDGSLLYRGLRVRMGIHTGTPESTYQHANGRQRYFGQVMDLAKAIGDAPAMGGQVLMSMDAWSALGTGARVRMAPIVVHNAGEHLIKDHLAPVRLMEVLPQSLRKRAPFPPIRSQLQISPGFFEAPCSASYIEECAPSNPIVIMFTFIGGVSRLKANPVFLESVALLVDFVRARLCHYGGYECEEKDGNFLLAFADPLNAALFSQDLQVGAMELPWHEELLRDEAASEVLPPSVVKLMGAEGEAPKLVDQTPVETNFLFRGLRIKIGLYYGIPARCMPHALTGRASYFGPLMNRSARISTTAANGQTLCNFELVEALQSSEDSHDLTFTSLGRFSLKGLAAPMQIFQVSSSRTDGRSFPRTRLFKSLVAPTGSVEAILTRRDTRDDIGVAIMPNRDLSPPLSRQGSGVHSDPGTPMPNGGRRMSGNWMEVNGWSGLSRQSSGVRSGGSSSPTSPVPWTESPSGRFFHANNEDGGTMPMDLPAAASLVRQASVMSVRAGASLTRQGSMPASLSRQGSLPMGLTQHASYLGTDGNSSASPPPRGMRGSDPGMSMSFDGGSGRFVLNRRNSLDGQTLPLVDTYGNTNGGNGSGSDSAPTSPMKRTGSWQALSRLMLNRPLLKNFMSKKVTRFAAGRYGPNGGGAAMPPPGNGVPQRNVFQELIELRATVEANNKLIQELRMRLECAGVQGTVEGQSQLPCVVPATPQVAINILDRDSSLDASTELLHQGREAVYMRQLRSSGDENYVGGTAPDRTSEDSTVAFFSSGGRASTETVGLYDPSALIGDPLGPVSIKAPTQQPSRKRLSTSFLKIA